MIISHKHQFVFLKAQKCAGTSIELALAQVCGSNDVLTRVTADGEAERLRHQPRNTEIPPANQSLACRVKQRLGLKAAKAGAAYYNHMPAAAIRRAMGEESFDAYRKVTSVRNPWDRELSLYFWRYRDSARRPSFEQYVRAPRFRPTRKTFEIYSIDGHVVADVVLRYESLERDFAAFVKTLGVNGPLQLPRAKSGVRPETSRDYRSFYSNKTRQIIKRRYAREIEAFGYEF